MASTITMYTTRFCPYCMRARQMLDDKNVAYTDLAVDNDPQLRTEMMQRSGQRTVPQIWVGEQHIGGFDDMYLLERQGQLDTLINRA
ncbi:MAG: glutaredoxin 3 [Bacteroidia bacterium]